MVLKQPRAVVSRLSDPSAQYPMAFRMPRTYLIAATSRLSGRYLAVARRRAGSPQFIHPHAMLRKGWELANAMLPGLDKAAAAAGAVTVNAMSDMKEVRFCCTVRDVPLAVLWSLSEPRLA